jgi:hypothetical protein
MAIDDKLEKILDEYEREAIATPGGLTIDAAINAIPLVGSSIAALISGKAQERVRRRTVDVFSAMKEEIESVEEQAIHKEFFESEEFQTLLALTIEQLQTTHDREKLKMLGKGLAHSGFKVFGNESRKELFVRSLRDLTPVHIGLMTSLLPEEHPNPRMAGAIWNHRPERKNYDEVSKLLIQHLVALGFMEERIAPLDTQKKQSRFYPWQPKTEDEQRRVVELLSKPPNVSYRVSLLGRDFLRYIGAVSSQPAN